MSRASCLVRSSPPLSAYLRLLCHRPYAQGPKHDVSLLKPSTPFVRRMGIFRDFSEHLKGEFKKNPELQNSVEQVKKKAVDLKERTKEASHQVGQQAKGVGAFARQVSSVVKGQVDVVKEKVLDATSQAKESVSGFRLRGSKSPHESGVCKGAHESSSQSEPSGMDIGRLFKGLRTYLSSASFVLDKVSGAKVFSFLRKGYSLLIDELTATPLKRSIKSDDSATNTVKRSASTALVPVVKKKTHWEKRWDSWKDKIRVNPLFKRVMGIKKHPVVTKSREIVEDVRDRWDTSDSPVVHKIQDLNDSLFGETATAVAVKEIRQRDPLFSFPDFLVEVQESTKPVLQAYLKGDLKELQKRCSREVVDRCRAERRAYESQGIFMDNKILHISDVEVKETKLMGNTPIIIVGFQTQQVYCVRDKHGNITQGAKDDIHTVFYAWAMQQVVPDDYHEGLLHPFWQLREMQQLGIQAII